MEKDEINELKVLIKETLEESRSVTENQYQIIVVKLENIQRQTERTNGRVTTLEQRVTQLAIDDQRHTANCPQAPRIDKLQEKVDQIVTNKKFMFVTLTIYSVILGIILTAINILKNT